MSELDRLYRSLTRLRQRPAHRRDAAWSQTMVDVLKQIEAITGRWESY